LSRNPYLIYALGGEPWVQDGDSRSDAEASEERPKHSPPSDVVLESHSLQAVFKLRMGTRNGARIPDAATTRICLLVTVN
jgi:hypothetical protein